MEKPHLPKSVTQVVKLYDPRVGYAGREAL